MVCMVFPIVHLIFFHSYRYLGLVDGLCVFRSSDLLNGHSRFKSRLLSARSLLWLFCDLALSFVLLCTLDPLVRSRSSGGPGLDVFSILFKYSFSNPFLPLNSGLLPLSVNVSVVCVVFRCELLFEVLFAPVGSVDCLQALRGVESTVDAGLSFPTFVYAGLPFKPAWISAGRLPVCFALCVREFVSSA